MIVKVLNLLDELVGISAIMVANRYDYYFLIVRDIATFPLLLLLY